MDVDRVFALASKNWGERLYAKNIAPHFPAGHRTLARLRRQASSMGRRRCKIGASKNTLDVNKPQDAESDSPLSCSSFLGKQQRTEGESVVRRHVIFATQIEGANSNGKILPIKEESTRTGFLLFLFCFCLSLKN